MKTASIILLLAAGAAHAQTQVDGYIRKDGTYVPPHVRSDSNDTKFDNYGSKGNFNPYSGKTGTVDPFKVDAPPAPKKYKF